MRRKDQEITDISLIEDIIGRSMVCRLGLCEDGRPYLVPLCFGYRYRVLYFHTAKEGKKLDILRRNQRVCFEFDIDHEIVRGEDACSWGMKYRSVVGFGKAVFVDEPVSKREALDVIMQHYAGSSFEYPEALVEITEILKVEIESMTGKISGYP
jgi:nitroimidazol reductase NimA-like FMN-containing flavoprotein (pyridoxamine 5'-phosphate oxidase superfamily)